MREIAAFELTMLNLLSILYDITTYTDTCSDLWPFWYLTNLFLLNIIDK